MPPDFRAAVPLAGEIAMASEYSAGDIQIAATALKAEKAQSQSPQAATARRAGGLKLVTRHELACADPRAPV
jgi:hypothetical protein